MRGGPARPGGGRRAAGRRGRHGPRTLRVQLTSRASLPLFDYITHTVNLPAAGNPNSLEARIISRARAEKQREAALRAMKTVSAWGTARQRATERVHTGMLGFAAPSRRAAATAEARRTSPAANAASAGAFFPPPLLSAPRPQFRVVDHPPMRLPKRDGQKMDQARKPSETGRGDIA